LIQVKGQLNEQIINDIVSNMDFIKSFLLCLLGVLLSFASGGLVGHFLLLGLLLGLEGSLLLFHDLFVLLNSLGVHLDGGVAQSTVVSIPMLSHEGSG
jgi:hypothetical protein